MPGGPRWARLAMPALLAAVLAVKVSVLLQLHEHPLLQPFGGLDAEYYVALGRQVAGGNLALGSEPYFLSPLYAYFLGAVFWVSGGSLFAARFTQILLGTAAVWLLYGVARRWAGRRAAVFTALLFGATGLFTFYEVLLLQAALDPLLTALDLALMTRAWRRDTAGAWLLAGGALGLHALNRPNVLAAACAVALAVVVWHRTRRSLVLAGALLGGAALLVAPATARNFAVSGDFVVISSHGGLNLLIGNNPQADGTYRQIPGITPAIIGQAQDAKRLAEQEVGHPLTAPGVSAYFADRALDWIRHEPARAALLFWRKLGLTFNAGFVPLNLSYPYYAGDESPMLRALAIGPWLLLPLGLLGLLWPGEMRRDGQWCAMIAWTGGFAVTVAAFFVSARYRMPLLVPLCVGAGAALDFLTRSAARREYRKLALMLAAGLVLAVLTNLPTGLDTGVAAEREATIIWLIDNGRTRDALDRLPRAEAGNPDAAGLLLRAGKAFDEAKDGANAVQFLTRAVGLDQTRSDTRLALGSALLHAGKPEQAVDQLGSAVALSPADPEGREALGLALAMLGRGDAARTELSEAHRLNPRSASICLNLAVVEAQAGRTLAARELAGEALRLRPGYPQALGLMDTLSRIR
jgi:Flp pilus assembly protein TadD